MLGCGPFHQEKDCPRMKSGNARESRKSNFASKMAYKRYRSPGGRSSSFTRNEKGDRFREMISPGGSKYREYRQRTPSGDRRGPKVPQNGTRQGTSPGRKPGGTYKVHSLALEDSTLHSDEYHNDVFSGPNIYPTSPDFNAPN